MSAPAIQRLLNERELAAQLNISVRTLQNWRLKGNGPAFIRLGSAIRYDPAVVDGWKAANSRRNTAA
jgi:predicted DNA-binding transcriptional regulator AlpA